MTVGLFANVRKARLSELAGPFLAWLEARGIPVLMSEELFKFLSPSVSNVRAVPPDAFAAQSDLVVAMGGDGSMLAAARLIGDLKKPLLGVNLGGLGFLAEVSVNELYPRMEKVLAGEYRIQERMAMEASVKTAAGIQAFRGLNDVVLDRGGSPRVVQISVEVDGAHFNTFRSDGLIVATPTGSTAYSLSASGPIVVPTLDCMILSPVCPHSLTARPTVVPAASTVRLRLDKGRSPGVLSIDGQVHMDVDARTVVEIRRAEHPVHWVTFDDHNFFDLLRRKLHWGGLPRE